jgi:hypothetical protein
MKLTKKQAEEARNRALDYEANMAVEGLFLSPEGREILDEIDRQRMGYEEGVQYVLNSLRERGIIPETLAINQ